MPLRKPYNFILLHSFAATCIDDAAAFGRSRKKEGGNRFPPPDSCCTGFDYWISLVNLWAKLPP